MSTPRVTLCLHCRKRVIRREEPYVGLGVQIHPASRGAAAPTSYVYMHLDCWTWLLRRLEEAAASPD